VFYGIRSERQLMEQLDYNLLYRWFVGLSPDDLVWDPTVFTKNRDRLQSGEVFAKFMTKLLNHPQVKPLLSDEHFSVDGTLIEAWASQNNLPAVSQASPRFALGREYWFLRRPWGPEWSVPFPLTKLEQDNGTGRIEVAEHRCR
jgi:Transposase domain (DUF772)